MPIPSSGETKRIPYWLTTVTVNGKAQTKVVYNDPNPANEGFLGLGAHGGTPPDGEEVVFDNGEVWDVPSNETEPAPLNDAAKQGDKYRAGQALKLESGTTTGVSAPVSQQYILRQNPDGTITQELNPNYANSQGKNYTDKFGNIVQLPPTGAEVGMNGEPAQPRVIYHDPSADIQAQQAQADLAYKQRLTANVGAAPQRAPRYADEEQLAALQVQKAQQDLQNPYVLKQQQLYAAIANIEDQMRRGEVNPEQGHQMMAYARQNLDASLRGTTPFQMEQDRLNRDMQERTQRQNVAQRLLDSQGQTAGSMTTGLVNGLGGIYGRINSSAFSGNIVNPLDFVSAVMNQYGGGTGLADSARGILQGLFQPQQGGS